MRNKLPSRAVLILAAVAAASLLLIHSPHVVEPVSAQGKGGTIKPLPTPTPKTSAQPSVKSKPARRIPSYSLDQLIGEWVGTGDLKGEIQTFLADGSGSDDDCGAYKYYLNGNILTFVYSQTCEAVEITKGVPQRYRISISSNKMRMIYLGKNGGPSYWEREK